MPSEEELRRYEESPEVQDIIRFFAARKPFLDKPAPPWFGDAVWAQIRQRQARRGFVAWMPRLNPYVWSPVLGILLLLSVSVHKIINRGRLRHRVNDSPCCMEVTIEIFTSL